MGIVFDIQRFCVNDGPGIRTVVFLKGCPLKCLWCHNPESNSIKRQLYCEWNRCAHCGTCAAVCGQRVHEMDHGVHRIRFSGCMLCGAGLLAVLDGLRIAGALISDRGDLPALLEVAVPECLLSLAWMPLIYLLFRAVYRKVGGDKLA